MPSSFYIIVGTLIVANFGTIVSMLIAAGKLVWWLSKLEAKVDKAALDVNAAHEKIRILEGRGRDM